MSNYEVNSRNKVKRIPKRGHYDQETIYSILDRGYLCHVGFSIDGQPFVIPTLYGRSENKIYIHGASTSRMLKTAGKRVPVCITVTHVDALVLARSAFHHSMNYRSAVVFGNAVQVREEGKNEALRVISENVIAGRWQEVRKPSDKELKATTVLQINIDQASAKVRTGPPGDDKEDYELDIWAGLLPLNYAVGEPQPDPLLKANIPVAKSVLSFE